MEEPLATTPTAREDTVEPMEVDEKNQLTDKRKRTSSSSARAVAKASDTSQPSATGASVAQEETEMNNCMPPHLDSYIPLDCNISNVSPDSGIQSVNGSPLHLLMSSPHHHHSPLYPMITTPRSGTEASGSSHRPYSPSLLDSPPPPVLQPAITPPHLASSSPHRSYDENPVSPEMPTLKCQVEHPPAWLLLRCATPSESAPPLRLRCVTPLENGPSVSPVPSPLPAIEITNADDDLRRAAICETAANEASRNKTTEPISCDTAPGNCNLQEQGMTNNRGPGRPDDEPKKRSRGRPKGSKNKKTLLAESTLSESSSTQVPCEELTETTCSSQSTNLVENIVYDKIEDRLAQNTLNEAKDSSSPNKETETSSVIDETTEKQPNKNGRGKKPVSDNPLEVHSLPYSNEPSNPIAKCIIDVANIITKDDPILTRARTPTLSVVKESVATRLESVPAVEGTKVKRAVGRPRKVPRSEPSANTNDDCAAPPEVVTKKTFSDQIVHKIINEKVRNSEKSDKLSVHGQTRDTGGGPPVADDDAMDENDTLDETSTHKAIDSRNNSPSVADKGSRSKSRRGARMEGIPLEERKRKRGRKKELPAIFRKVYGSLVDDNKLWTKPEKTHPATKAPAAVTADLESIPIAAASKALHKKKKKKHKQFKSKHKNIVDPAFLASLEELLIELEGCHISKLKPTDGPAADAPLPSIFRVKRGIFPHASKKRRAADKRTSDRESGTEGENSKASGKRKKKLQELPKQVRLPKC